MNVTSLSAALGRISIGLGVALLTSCASTAEPADAGGPLAFASDPWAPFTDQAPRPRVALKLVEEALTRSGAKARTAIQPDFDAVLTGLKAGRFDGCAALWKTPEREQFLRFSAPYFENRLVVVGRAGSPVDVTTLRDLGPAKIALVEGYAYGVETAGLNLAPGPSDVENLARLAKSQVDYALVDAFVAHHLVRGHAKGTFAVGSTPLAQRSLHLAVRRDLPGGEALLRRFNAAMRQMLESGRVNRALCLDWVQADVDGDGAPELVGSGRSETEPPAAYPLFDGEQPAKGYVVNGKRYEDWKQVPKRSPAEETPLLDFRF